MLFTHDLVSGVVSEIVSSNVVTMVWSALLFIVRGSEKVEKPLGHLRKEEEAEQRN